MKRRKPSRAHRHQSFFYVFYQFPPMPSSASRQEPAESLAEVVFVWAMLLLLTAAKIDCLARQLPKRLPFPFSFSAKLGLLPLRAWTFLPAMTWELVGSPELEEDVRSEERPAAPRLETKDSGYFGSETASQSFNVLDGNKLHEEIEEIARRNEALMSTQVVVCHLLPRSQLITLIQPQPFRDGGPRTGSTR